MNWKITDSKALEDRIFKLKLRVASSAGIQEGMTVVDMGCGQGGFTAAVAKLVGEKGRVLAVDVTDEYLVEFAERVNKYGVKSRVTFIQADGTCLKERISDDAADMVVSFRLLEELKKPEYMPEIVREMVRVAKNNGEICLTELSTVSRNKAEEVYIRLHRESGDCFFRHNEIVETMERCGLGGVSVKNLDTDVWLSPDLAKQDLSFAQIWFDSNVEKTLGSLIEKYGMKYPELLIFSGKKHQKTEKK